MSHPDIKESLAHDFTAVAPDLLSVSQIETKYGDLLCLKPDMTRLKMDMVFGEIPSQDNDSIIIAFAGAFTGKEPSKGHANIAGDHAAEGERFKGYPCERNTGAFTWLPSKGYRFHYQDYSSALDEAAAGGGIGFAQEMMIHDGQKVNTTRPAGNVNVFRALCLDADGQLAIYESQGKMKFGNFIDALYSQGVKEALYTDMGFGWNYCFYRKNIGKTSPTLLHPHAAPDASNFVTI